MSAKLTFDPRDDVAAPYVAKGARPKVAVLREQGATRVTQADAALVRDFGSENMKIIRKVGRAKSIEDHL